MILHSFDHYKDSDNRNFQRSYKSAFQLRTTINRLIYKRLFGDLLKKITDDRLRNNRAIREQQKSVN